MGETANTPIPVKLNFANPRIKIACDIAEGLKDIQLEMDNELRGILLGGSVSRGTDDKYSDVEILLFMTTVPTLEDRHRLISLLNFEKTEKVDFDNNEDNLLVNGIQVDLVYYTDDYDVPVITDVTEYCLPDYSVMGNIDTIRNGIILWGDDYLSGLKEQCADYKDGLGENIIIDNLNHLHNGNMDVYVERNNPTEFYTNVITLQKKVFNILSAINKKYIGGYKWMYRELSAMKTAPEGLGEKYSAMFSDDKHEVIESMSRIIQETLHLANQTYPNLNLDVDKIMYRYSLKREQNTRIL